MVRRTENPKISRREWLRATAVGAGAATSGCFRHPASQAGFLEKVWGLRGATPGRLNRPRAIAIDKDDLLYIVDMTPQIQVFTGEGEFIRGWQTPEYEHGRPSGLAFDRAGNLMVCDTHYFRVLFFIRDKLTDRIVQLCHQKPPSLTDFVSQFLQPKSLHPMIIRVEHEHPAARIAGDSPGLIELPIPPSVTAKQPAKLAIEAEFLDSMIAKLA